MPRPQDLRPISHPTVIGPPRLARYLGRSRVIVTIRCPRCGKDRERTASETRRELLRPNFKGYCRACAIASVKDGSHRWVNYKRGPKTRLTTSAGYAMTFPEDVPDELLPMYRAMQNSGQPVAQHRWVMAVHLGRPLTSAECVDHMNGVKTDNSVDNLRIYVRGKQQPGSCPGHGTYYHEWQMALLRIRELENQISGSR